MWDCATASAVNRVESPAFQVTRTSTP